MSIADHGPDPDLVHALGGQLPLEDRLRLAAYVSEQYPIVGRLLPLLHEAADTVEQMRELLEDGPRS
jgi:hypothetical protein